MTLNETLPKPAAIEASAKLPKKASMKVLVIGATGGTGREIVRQAQAGGHPVVALVRDAAKARSLLPGAELVEGDVRDEAVRRRALSSCGAVISALGTGIHPFGRVALFSEGAKAIISAMRLDHVTRLVCITGIGAGDSRGHGGFLYDRLVQPLLLRTVYEDKDRQEKLIRQSGLDWVIVRPVTLKNEAARGSYRVLTDLSGFHGGEISRADVAAFAVGQLASDAYLGKTPLISW
jgi:putative NADH-flavin reductase